MSSSEDKLRDYLNRVTLDLRKTRRQLQEVTERDGEPIAILGIGCRYPGGIRSAEDFWAFLRTGGDGIVGFPGDRGWPRDLYDPDPDRVATTTVTEGGFIEDAAEFDAGFFGISPREAIAMDPQQRLLLETCWEACEHAAVDPTSLRGSETGVFVGIYPFGYGGNAFDRDDLQGFRLTGTTCSVASGRVAYTLGLEGPAISIDTACSSSLVALHLAVQALRRRECSLALVGGATVIAGPEIFIDFSRQRGLAPDARCKTFADAADGTAWGEGVGVLLVERLSDAQRHGHRVLAVVRGSAVNQDGASNGLTAPNGPAQQRVIQAALLDAKLSAGDVDAVEAHGTATRLGDPIEAQALLATYGLRPSERPLWLGSVKSNIGHTQAAAGIAGVIKMVMALRHQRLPKTMHVDRPSTRVDWSEGAVSLLTEERPWPIGEMPRRAGVSSFGISGTNSHVILEEAPPASGVEVHEPDPLFTREISAWILSARDATGLSAQADCLEAHLRQEPNLTGRDVGRALAKRPALDCRAVLLGGSRAELASNLGSAGRAEPSESVLEGSVHRGGRVVFVFPGQGAQWQGMACELLADSPLFARSMDACAEALSEYLDWSLYDVLGAVPGAPALDRIDVVQPVLFAVMVSLADLWRGCGVKPTAVVGHSQGEIAAAYVAGGLSLGDASRVVALRSKILTAVVGQGAVVSVAAPLARVEELLEGREGRLFVGGVNGPRSVAVVGDQAELVEFLGECAAADIRAREVRATVASHCPQVESLREELLVALSGITPRSSDVAFYSTVTGGLLDTAELDPDYWYRNMREPVQFEGAMRSLLADRTQALVEVSPHPVLTIGMRETIDAFLAEVREDGRAGEPTTRPAVGVLGSLRRAEPERERFVRSLSEAWTHGIEVDWAGLLGGAPAELVELPTYPFQRRHYWLESGQIGEAMAIGQARPDHPLLGAVVALADESGWLFTGRLSLRTHPWLSDHAVAGVVLVPGTALLELALHAGGRIGCEQVSELILEAPLVLDGQSSLQLQVSLGAPEASGRRPIQIYARTEARAGEELDLAEGWTRHASGSVEPCGGETQPECARPIVDSRLSGEWPPQGASIVDLDDLYATFADRGLEYGPVFQGLDAAWRLGEELFSEIGLPDDQHDACALFGIHPALLDAALHVGGVDWDRQSDPSTVRLPFAWRDVRLHRGGASRLRVVMSARGENEISLIALDGDGELVMSVGSLLVRPLAAERLRGESAHAHSSLFAIQWKSASTVQTPARGRWGLLGVSARENRQSLRDAGLSIEEYADLGSLRCGIEEGTEAPETVIWEAAAEAGEGLAGAARARARETLELAQTWLAQEALADSRLVVLTRGAVATRCGEDVPGLADSVTWGLIRSAQVEHPGRFLLVDMDGEEPSREALASAVASAVEDGEPQVAIREGLVCLPRLTRPPLSSSRPEPLRSKGAVLITGGTGQLGGLLARRLISAYGVESLVLTSRKGRKAPGAAELQDELTTLGARVRIVKCDVSDRAQLCKLIDSIAIDGGLSGVVHAAGALDDALLSSLSPARLDSVLAPKVDAAVHLHELTQELDLQMFVLFSSAAGVLGASGQANYAAANAFLDALAAHRRARGMVASSMAWGLWEQVGGMAAGMSESDVARMRRAGIQALGSEEALDLFEAARHVEDALTVPVRLDLSALRVQARSSVLPPLFSELVQVPTARATRGASGSLLRRLASLNEQARHAAVLELVSAHVASVLGHASTSTIDAARPFKELGFDSLLAVELSNRLSGLLGLRLPATLVFDYPTGDELVAHLLAQIEKQPRASSPRDRVAHQTEEPLAIVGMSCRYPGGVGSPAELWDLLASGEDAISPFPEDRGWSLRELADAASDHAETTPALEGGFVYDACDFDASFFGIGPREARMMDPQQRLLLEACWEALENAGLDPLALKGSETGVFAGISSQDYAVGRAETLPQLDGYGLTGNAGSVISGRVAYTFGLEGPAVTVDTACSSSLVSMHLAGQSLLAGECSLALAGGVTVQCSPAVWLEFSRQRGLAPDARCKPFADGADGAGFSEGVGVVALERLSDALRLGHPVLALVRGSAVNQDGASNGLTAPNGPSQQRVILRALANAGLVAHEVDAVEAHGTGTTLGDPIEAQALLATYGQGRPPGRPLWLGSVKSNIGHTQAAAGVAGVIKMVMALRREMIPRTLHIDRPAESVDWSAGAVSLLREAAPWPSGGTPRRVGVSSFGISGTNAHLILEEAPLLGPGAEQGREAPSLGQAADGEQEGHADGEQEGQIQAAFVLWPLSGKGESALCAQAERLASHCRAHPELSPLDVGLSLARRSTFEDRAVVSGGDRQELLAGLDALATGRPEASLLRGRATSAAGGKLAFLFSGQGAQRPGMGRELCDAFPLFRGAFEEVCAHLDPLLERPLAEVVLAQEGSPEARLLDDTSFTQPALFAIELALFRLLQSFGLRPDYLIGHSVGELTAAHVAGALSLADASALVAGRGRMMGSLPLGGAMVAVQATERELGRSLEGLEHHVSVAAVNGPSSTVVSGEREVVERLVGEWEEEGRKVKRLEVSHAFHSPLMEPMLEELTELVARLSFSEPTIPIVSNLTGEPVGVERICDPLYWRDHARQAVLFAKGVSWLHEQGVTRFLEVGPDAILTAMCHESLTGIVAVPALRREHSELSSLTAALSALWLDGSPVDWGPICNRPPARPVALPTYAFQRERYWLESSPASGDLTAIGLEPAHHPLLQATVPLAAGEGGALFTGHISLRTCPWLADHAVMGAALLPGTALLELALQAGSRVGCRVLEELTLEAPLVLSADGASQLQVTVGEQDEHGRRSVAIHARASSEDGADMTRDPWTCHASGTLLDQRASTRKRSDAAESSEQTRLLSGVWPPESAQALDIAGLYDELAELGLEYGPAFQRLRAAWRKEGHLLVEVGLSDEQQQSMDGFAFHPALLDAALHAFALEDHPTDMGSSEHRAALRVPFSWRGVELRGPGASTLRICLSPSKEGEASLEVADSEGQPVARIDSLVTRVVSQAEMTLAEHSGRDRSLSVHWDSIRLAEPSLSGERWALLGSADGSSSVEDLRAGGVAVEAHAGMGQLLEAIEQAKQAPHTLLIDCLLGTGAAVAPEDESSDPSISTVHGAVRDVLVPVQRWLADSRLADTSCVVVTAGALAIGPGDAPPRMELAAVAGLLRSAQSENPGRLIHVDLDSRSRDWGLVPVAVASARGMAEPQVAIRNGALLAPRLRRAVGPSQSRPGKRESELVNALDREGTALITGGTGALGALIARHLVSEHGLRSVVLLSRRGPNAEGAEELRAELARLGADVSVIGCDVAEREQVEAAIASVPEGFPLRVVVHAAGLIEDGVIGSLSPESVDRVLRSKVDGAIHLHELTRDMDLSAFVMFSSLAGILGGAGQGNYAAANAALDGLAMRRRAEGLPAVSIAWGPWSGAAGLAGGLSDRDRARIGHAAIRALDVEDGLELFDAACASGEALAVPVRFDMRALGSWARSGTLPALLRGLVAIPTSAPRPGREGSLARRFAEAPSQDREGMVLGLVRAEAAAALGHRSPEKIPAERAFKDLGFDSLAAVDLRNRLDVATGLRLPSTLVFDYPDAASLATHLFERLSERDTAKRRVTAVVRAEEPIAIVGMACRYPGAVQSPQELWDLVARGGDAISPFPEDRGWDLDALYDPDPDSPRTSYAKEGGFVRDAASFDGAFFGVGPREALAMDPQQRLLLEVSWEALEDARIDPASLRGSQTGVYAGVMYQDYGSSIDPSQAAGLEGYLGTGSSGSVVSGRVAYTFGLQGPAVSVNTACSSSLVASHLASQALRDGECSLALVGGVTVMWTPVAFVEFARQRGLAPDGRCKAYADCADGTGWGEGVGVLVLERLSEARRLGHSVLAIIRGSAINQDGASNGLTAPNGPSQQQVIRQALANAKLSPQDVDAVEGHGTGTALGDPIEAQALLATYGQARPRERPLWLGSVKSNIGHTQAAAGMAGVIKMVMAMRHSALPRTLHVDRPSSEVDWSSGAVSLLTDQVPWPRLDRPRRAAVSSFGISGTNAHLILEEPPSEQEPVVGPTARPASGPRQARAVVTNPERPGALLPRGILPWVLSAEGHEALRAQARRLADHLTSWPELSAADVGYSLLGRPRLGDRAVLLGGDRQTLAEALDALARGESSANVVRGACAERPRGAEGLVAFLFTGQGAQRVGMGAQLYEQLPLYARAFDEVCAHLDEHLQGSVRDIVLGVGVGSGNGLLASNAGGGASNQSRSLDHTAFAQAGLFALEVALFRLLEGFGMKPDYLIGHSIGELAAAHVSGALSLEDACRLVAARGQLMGELPRGGAMVAVQATEQEALESLDACSGDVELAAVNGPSSVVLSGDEQPVLELAALWEGRSRKVKRLRVSHAFHSARMDGMLERFGEIAGEVPFGEPQIPIVSNLSGEPLAAQEIGSADYWVRHVRNTVRFGDGIAWLGAQGVRCFVELGPDGVLSAMSREIVGGDGSAQAESETDQITAVSLLRGERPEGSTLMRALAQAFVGGAEINWAGMFEGTGASSVKLPTYPFQRKHYWLAPKPASRDMAEVGQTTMSHPLLGAALELAGERGGVFTGRLSPRAHPWLADHAVMGAVLLPGTAYVELALHVGRELGAELVHELTFEAPLIVDEQTGILLQVSVGDPEENGLRALEIYSREDSPPDGMAGHGGWTRHASGLLGDARAHASWGPWESRSEPLRESWPPRDAEPMEMVDLYERLAERGMDYGTAFQGVRGAWRRGQELFAEVSLAEDQLADAELFAIHPALLDAAFHLLIDMDAPESQASRVSLPFSFSGVELGVRGARLLRVRLFQETPGTMSMIATDEMGTPVVSVDSVARREVSAEQLSGTRERHHESLFRAVWSDVPMDPRRDLGTGRWALLGERDRSSELLIALSEAGLSCELHASARALTAKAAMGEVLPDMALLDCRSLPDEELPGSLCATVNRALETVQEWLSQEPLSSSRLVLLTSGAVVARQGEDLTAGLAGAAVWGLVQSAQAESPGRLVLIDCDEAQSSWWALAGALGGGEPRLALREGTVLRQGLERVPRAPLLVEDTSVRVDASTGARETGSFQALASIRDSGSFGPEKTVLITGGTGGLGALVARHLVRAHGVRHLLLVSRSGPDAQGASELEAELVELGTQVRVVACDVSVREQLERLLDSLEERHPLGAVVHTAAVMDNGLIDALTPERVERVLGPKAQAAWHLHELTSNMALSAFVLFSSIAGLFGGPGQGSYAAANVFLDRLAEHRRVHGLAATSIVWGLWGDVGAGTEMGQLEVRRVVGSSSMGVLASELGLELLDTAIAGEEATVLAAQLDMAILRAETRAGVVTPLLRGLVNVARSQRTTEQVGSMARRLVAMPREERMDALLGLVRGEAAGVLGLASASAVGPGRAFKEIGFDSLAAVELRNRLGAATGLRLPATLIFDYPNPRELAQCLLAELEHEDDVTGPSVDGALEAIELMLSQVGHAAERQQVAARLRACLSTLDGESEEEDLATATDEEMFEILDAELGAL